MRKVSAILFEVYVALLASIPTRLGEWIRFFAYRPLFRKAGRFRIQDGVTIEGFHNIELGTNVSIMKNSYLYAVDDGRVRIGDNFSMNVNSLISASGGRVVIGCDCLIGPNCVLRADDHRFDRLEVPINRQGHMSGEIRVEDDVWIGANCVVTRDTKIGQGAVVAAGAVVTRDVEPYAIVGGVPARMLRSRREAAP